jgi:hypothetical protein
MHSHSLFRIEGNHDRSREVIDLLLLLLVFLLGVFVRLRRVLRLGTCVRRETVYAGMLCISKVMVDDNKQSR